MTNPVASQQPAPICKHCGKPVWQPEKHGGWYHDDSAGTLRCCDGKQVATPLGTPGSTKEDTDGR